MVVDPVSRKVDLPLVYRGAFTLQLLKYMSATWADLGLSDEMVDVLLKAGFTAPTDVQIAAVPPACRGDDLIVSARTGSGKTATFALPMIDYISGRKGTTGLVLAPTREIAQQIHATFERFGKPRGVNSAVFIGGIDYRHDKEALANRPEVIIATPGRLCDHIERGNLWLEFIEIVVLDEADRMLDMGFSQELNRIVKELGPNRQTLMYSATMPSTIEKLARQYLRDGAERITVGTVSKPVSNVKQKLIWVKEDHKKSQLARILEEEKGPVIVFVRTKDMASLLFRTLHSRGFHDVTAMHSNMEQKHREQALVQFKSGQARILIATDVVGRGIHVEGVAHVVNFDVPLEAEDYTHRIGRTGRISVDGTLADGRATTLATPRDRALVRAIEEMAGSPIQVEYADNAIRDLILSGGREEGSDRERGRRPGGGGGPRRGAGGGGGRRSGGGARRGGSPT
jgi:ATP-dependent RNA helicase RhlE